MTAASTATVSCPRPRVQAVCELMETDWSPWHVVLYELNWNDYERLLDARAAAHRRRLKMTYDRGTAEIYSPVLWIPDPPEDDPTTAAGTAMTIGNRHERCKKLLARMLESVALGWRISVVACGNVTLKRPELAQGLEPDECYYIQNANRVTDIRELDLTVDPPPDLAIEIESTRTIVDRWDLFHALGIPEIWCYDGERVRMLVRSDAPNYTEVNASRAFPLLTVERLSACLARVGTVDDTTLCLELLDWARQSPST